MEIKHVVSLMWCLLFTVVLGVCAFGAYLYGEFRYHKGVNTGIELQYNRDWNRVVDA